MTPYPMLFHPILKERVWGGRKLASLSKRLPPGAAIGESWELADLPLSIADGRSVIANGPLAGRTLHDAIEEDRDAIMGDGSLTPEGGFPLLIKYLDARENLSVQVHPDEEYAAAHPGAHVKSEAWVVIEAEPGSVIYKGVKPEITRERFRADVEAGGSRAADDLVRIPVKPGDCHYLPSGTCHALGAGILVAEVQTPSDTTFRVYDWGRTGEATGGGGAGGRELHLEQAMQCIRFEPLGKLPNRPKPYRPIVSGGLRTTSLAVTKDFDIERVDSMEDTAFAVALSGLPEIWMFIAGSGRIETAGGPKLEGAPGTTVLLPAGLGRSEATLRAGASMLVVKLPSPLKGMIANDRMSAGANG